MKQAAILFIIFFLTGCGQSAGEPAISESASQPIDQPTAIEQVKEVVRETATTATERVKETVVVLQEDNQSTDVPATFDHADMAFARQAPFGDWENPFYQDGCEEASLVIVKKFFDGQPLDEAIMKTELDAVESWELARFGYNLSVDTEEVAIMAREYYQLDVEISDEVTVERIKRELVAGNLIILPLLGREINNPNFTAPGPLYHMLVVRGYARDQFITNDPGTRLGKGYKYPYDVLINATRDWNGGDISNGERLMLIVKKPKT